MKTFDELIASGTLVEIAEAIKARSEQFAPLAAKSATTQADLDEMNRLDDEMEKLTVKQADLKKIEDAKTRNAARTKAFGVPVGALPFTGEKNADGSEKKSYIPAHSTARHTMKHIAFGTRQENEEQAYKFFMWFASQLDPRTGLQAKAAQFCADHGLNTKTINEGTNDQGGALVPQEFDATLIRLVETYGVFRNKAMLSNMSGETKTQPRRTAGITTYWVGEGQTITASNPTFDNVMLVAKKLAAVSVMSSEVNEDSALSIADILAFEMAYGFALAEDQAGFNGDGTSTYGGITGVLPKLKGLSGTIANIAGLFVGAGNAYSELLLTDFEGTVGLLPQYADPRAEWYCHKSFFHTVMQRLELAAGGVTAREISEGDRRGRPLFLGYPVNFTQVMPRIEANSQVCALFGDLALAATFGDRRRRTMFTDPYSLSTKDQILVRSTERLDINVHDCGNSSATAGLRVPGPIVGLITAAS